MGKTPKDVFGKGYLTTEQLMCQGIPFNRIDEWLSSGLIRKADRGVYCLPGTEDDEYALIQRRYDRCIFSGITALSLHRLSDHISENYHVTFPQGYNPSSLKECQWNISVTRCIPEIYGLGRITIITENENEIAVYDKERSLCDIVRGKGMAPFIVKTAMKRYFDDPERDEQRLISYSERLHVKDRILRYCELYQ